MTALVDTTWVAAHLQDPSVRLLESNEDLLLYRMGHLPGAAEVWWDSDLQATTSRDVLDAAAFAHLMERLGIARKTTVVLYGDRLNGWAAYAFWVLRYYGHPEVRLMDGGRERWINEGRALTMAPPTFPPTSYPLPECRPEVRVLAPALLDAVRGSTVTLIDARPKAQYACEVHPSIAYPTTGAHRGGHIPGAVNVPWHELFDAHCCLKTPDELRQLYAGAGADLTRPVVTYCIIGIGSSVTYIVLHDVLGHQDVRNYDGAWLEWGSSIGYPIIVDRAGL